MFMLISPIDRWISNFLKEKIYMSSYNKSKSTKRFTYSINRNDTAKQAGSNIVTIQTNPQDGQYSVGQSSLTMTVKEAMVLQSFLDRNLSPTL
jgi:hypothetical protein